MKNKYQRMIALMRQILRKMRVPLYFHKKSNHIFTLHQHIIMLVLRQYESKSYESFVEWLQVSDNIVQMLGIKTIPHFTTLQKAAARLSDTMLHVAIGRFIGLVCPGRLFAGADATGFEDGHATSYYTHRASLKRSFARIVTGSDMVTQLIIAVVIQNHANGHEISNFPALFKDLTGIVTPQVLVLDKGYDAEWVHQMIRKHGILSVIPVRNKSDRIGRIKGRCRKEMKRSFDDALYHQRNKCETIFSVIKRRFRSEIRSYNDAMKERELLYRLLAYNCHRMCMISCLLWMVSR
ncbi:MAG: transposase [Thaumarchaeota archaeon]|nr:transposase [Nitrososphaerota archaeon]